MRTNKTWKRICGLMLTLVLMLPCVTLPAYADGSFTVSGNYPQQTSLPAETTFYLYKVGGFDRDKDDPAKSILVLDEALSGFGGQINLGIQKSDYEGADAEEKWTEDWLKQAKTLADWLESQDPLPVDRQETTTDSAGDFVFGGSVPNGLYLLTGTRSAKVPGEDNKGTYYTPRPMFIQVLNGNAEVSVKTESEAAEDFTVVKEWNDEGKKILRPASIDIKINYNNELNRTVTFTDDSTVVKMANDKDIDTITYTAGEGDTTAVSTVNKDGTTTTDTLDEKFVARTYSWEAREKKGETEYEWTCVEDLSTEDSMNYYYSTETSVQNKFKVFRITNTFERYNLKIVKLTDQIVTASESSNIVAAFEISGKIGDEEVYTGSASAVIDKERVEIDVPNIPRNLDTLTVKEVYSGGNYTPVNAEQTFDVRDLELHSDGQAGTQYYQVEFENKYNGDTIISGGIVNTFKQIGSEGYEIIERAGANADDN